MVVHALLRQFSKALFSESLPKALKTNQQHVKSHLLSEREYHPSIRTNHRIARNAEFETDD